MEQENELNYYIPRKLDAPPKFLWWDWDVAMVGLSGLGFGIISGYLWQCILISAVLAYLVSKSKSGKRNGFSAHLAYWYLGIGSFNKRTPPSNIREFYG